jgi:hypothetical protein
LASDHQAEADRYGDLSFGLGLAAAWHGAVGFTYTFLAFVPGLQGAAAGAAYHGVMAGVLTAASTAAGFKSRSEAAKADAHAKIAEQHQDAADQATRLQRDAERDALVHDREAELNRRHAAELDSFRQVWRGPVTETITVSYMLKRTVRETGTISGWDPWGQRCPVTSPGRAQTTYENDLRRQIPADENAPEHPAEGTVI